MKHILDNGLILQDLAESFERDAARLPEFYFHAFDEKPPMDENGLYWWVMDLIQKHPSMSPEDFFYVVDPAADDKIVSAVLLIPQDWHYAGIEIGVGRIEIVATDATYRRRGLVRALMQAAHERSAALGHQMQMITGIPHFYRQFGYTMAVDLGSKLQVPFHHIKDRDADALRFTLREATVDDIPTLIAIDEYAAQSALMSYTRTDEIWRHSMTERNAKSEVMFETYMIDNSDGEAVGYFFMRVLDDDDKGVYVWQLALNDRSNYLDVYDDLLLGIKQMAEARSEAMHFVSFGSTMHPALNDLVRHHRGGWVRASDYAYYLRVDDIPAFLLTIAPLLQQRLVGTGAHRFSGDVYIDLYEKQNIALRFEAGLITEARYVASRPDDVKTSLGMAKPYFVDMLVGYRTVEDIISWIPDAFGSRDAIVLFKLLFPTHYSSVFALR